MGAAYTFYGHHLLVPPTNTRRNKMVNHAAQAPARAETQARAEGQTAGVPRDTRPPNGQPRWSAHAAGPPGRQGNVRLLGERGRRANQSLAVSPPRRQHGRGAAGVLTLRSGPSTVYSRDGRVDVGPDI